MYYALTGTIVDITDSQIAVDVNGIGFELFVSRPAEWKLGEKKTIYTYEVYSQDDHYLVGFTNKLEKEAFGSLIQVKGIGPKTAINALSATTPSELFKAIQANNTAYLKKLPGIGPKAAAQIILDLKGRLADATVKGDPHQYDEVRAALRSLGFKSKDIDDTLAKINEPDASNEEILRLALRQLGKGSRS